MGEMLKIDGFDDMIKKLQSTSKAADGIAKRTADKCAQIMQAEIKSEAQKAGVPDELINKVVTIKEKSESKNRYKVSAGLKWENPPAPNKYNDALKAIVLNYGTPEERHTAKGYNRGKIKATNFMKKAKNKASKKIKSELNSAYEELNKELER